MNKPITDLQHPKMLLDPYAAWATKEGVPITEDFGVDLLAVATAPWPRFGVEGGLVHLKGRGDFVSIFVLDLPPGAKSAPQKHLFEEVVYVLSGHGNTTVEASDGRKQALYLTIAGAAALEQAKRCIGEHEAWLKSRFTAGEIEKLVEMLARIHE